MSRLAGKVALVTGTTQDMGASIARRLAREGASVLGAARNAERGEATAKAIREQGGQAAFVQTDIRFEDQVQRAVAMAAETWGRLDIVVNNAAAIDVIQGGADGPIVDESTDSFDHMMKVGVYGPFWLCKYAVPVMLRGGGGSVVNISSLASTCAVPGLTGYAASKAALEALTRQVAVDYGPRGIRANTVLVGSIQVAGTSAIHEHPIAGPALRGNTMVDRFGAPDDVAAMVAFLCSEDAGFVTGGIFPVDGGASVKQHVPDISALSTELA